MSKIKLQWNGEKIKQLKEVEEYNMTPKELIDSIDDVKGQIDKMKQQESQLKITLEKNKENITNAKSFLFDREKFENKCIEILKNKLERYYNDNFKDLKLLAESEAEGIISKDPEAYTDQMIKNQKYVIFQNKLATNPKVAKNIPARIIKSDIFDKPFFSNPFN